MKPYHPFAAHRLAIAALTICTCGLAAGDNTVSVRLSMIDEGVSWVTPHWGWHASKLVHDGHHYYTIGNWGVDQPSATGVLYRLEDDQWVRGYEWDDLNYQPGQILLDYEGRLLIVYGRRQDRPAIKRAAQPSDFHNFENLPVPEWLSPAGYVGGSVHGNKLILGYIGSPNVYSFNIAILDMETLHWRGPFMLAEGQREVVPFTTWRYPIIHPDDDGFHLVVTSGKDGVSPRRHEFYYMYLDHDVGLPVDAQLVDGVEPVEGQSLVCDATAMHQAEDGTLFITGQYTTVSQQYQLCVWRRPYEGIEWTRQSLSTNTVQVNGAFVQRTDDSDSLWLLATSGSQSRLQLYRHDDEADEWDEWSVDVIGDHVLGSVYSLHVVQTISGSTIPTAPVAIFPSREPSLDGAGLGWRTWLAEINLYSAGTPVHAGDMMHLQ